MEINFSGKRALVTGAASGIGRSIAILLSKCNATVVAVDISKENLADLKMELPNIETLVVDLTDWKSTETAVASILPIDLLVNNAGIGFMKLIPNVTEDSFDRMFGIHVKAVVNITRLVVKDLQARNAPGAIVNMSSIASRIGSTGMSLYSSAKGSIESFTRALAVELGPNNIRVNSVHPTIVRTKMTASWFRKVPELEEKTLSHMPLNRFPETEDVAEAVAFLLSDKAKMITGSMLPIDCGYLCKL